MRRAADLAFVLAALMAGCDSQAEPNQRYSRTEEGAATATASDKERGERGRTPDDRRSANGREMVHTPDGGKIVLPKPATAPTAAAGRRCALRQGSGVRAPPRPGVRANILPSGVQVLYRFPRTVSECRPAFLVVSVAWSTGEAAPTSVTRRIPKLRGAITVHTAQGPAPPPDIVSVSAVTASGRRGLPSVVHPR